MIDTFKRANIEAVENDFAFQLVPILFDVVVLHHDDYHINIVDELVEVVELVFGYLVVFQERVITF